jgi:hypothetical protein
MDYETFCKLLEILQPKLEQHGSLAPNGKIPIELKLSAALRWFGDGSYLDILISHSLLSKAEVYNCAWDVVEAINSSPELQIKFPAMSRSKLLMSFQESHLLGSQTVLAALMGCWCGLKSPVRNSARLLVLTPESFIARGKESTALTCKVFVMQSVVSLIHQFNILPLPQIILLLSRQISVVTSRQMAFLHQVCVCMGKMHMLTALLWQFLFPKLMHAPPGSKDHYNFYHLQIRINIECSFGVLTALCLLFTKSWNEEIMN